MNINSFLIGYIWHYFRAWISQTNLYYYVDIYVYNSVSLSCNATLNRPCKSCEFPVSSDRIYVFTKKCYAMSSYINNFLQWHKSITFKCNDFLITWLTVAISVHYWRFTSTKCPIFNDRIVSMEFHGSDHDIETDPLQVPWNSRATGAIEAGKLQVLVKSMEFYAISNEIPWIWSCRRNRITLVIFKFGNTNFKVVPWNYMLFPVFCFQWHKWFHEMSWNLIYHEVSVVPGSFIKLLLS